MLKFDFVRFNICGKHADDNHNKRLYIDHDHETGKVRGLLCLQCNTALGLLKDNPKVLKKALKYLTRKIL